MVGIERIKAALKRPGKTKIGLAAAMSVTPSAITALLKGERQLKADEVPMVAEYLDLNSVFLMGFVGAGGVIEPEFEQIPPEGLETIDMPFAIPDDMIAFEVRGHSMMPRYEDGDVILAWRGQKRQLASFYGEEAIVRTRDGRRYLKIIERGPGQTVNLRSFNAPPIEATKLDWIGEIYLTMRRGQLRRLQSQEAARARRAALGNNRGGHRR